MFLVGDRRAGQMTRVIGIAQADALMALFESYAQ